MTRISRFLAALAVLALPPLSPAIAGERPLIWEPSKSSDTSYSVRMGSHLPTDRASSMGAEVRMRGPNPEQFGNPVSLWGTVTLAEPPAAGDGRSTRLDARIDGHNGRRRVSLNNTLTKSLPGLDAELCQDYALDYEPLGDGRLHAQAAQSVRLSSPRTGMVLHMRTSRSDDEGWRTSIGIEQPLRNAITLTATIEDPARESRKGRFRASYRYNW